MTGFLLDTNHLGEALRPVSRVRDRIGQLHLAGFSKGQGRSAPEPARRWSRIMESRR